MNQATLSNYRVEIKQARKIKRFRAAFGSIVQRSFQHLQHATKAEIDQFCEAIGAPDYYNEAKKHINVIQYDIDNRYN